MYLSMLQFLAVGAAIMMIAFLPGCDQTGRPPQRYLKGARMEENKKIPACLGDCLLLSPAMATMAPNMTTTGMGDDTMYGILLIRLAMSKL